MFMEGSEIARFLGRARERIYRGDFLCGQRACLIKAGPHILACDRGVLFWQDFG
jgi:hypothetical protein